MKKITIIVLALLLCLSSVSFSGRKKAPRSGKIKDNVFTDAKYNFQITLPEGWKAKRSKKDDVLRLTLKKEENKKILKEQSLDNPIMLVINSGDYTNIPRVNIWVVETELPVKDYLKTFISVSNESKFKSAFIKAISPVWSDATFNKFETMNIEKLLFSGHNAIKWSGFFIHSYLVAENSADARLGGAMYVIEHDDGSVMFICLKSEIEVIDEVIAEIQPTLNSIKWNK